MSTLSEIEAAIELLPAPQVEELAKWIESRRERPAATVEGHPSVRSFFGKTRSGRADGADNAAIDRDLASGAARGLA